MPKKPYGRKSALIWVGMAHVFDITTYLGPQNCATLFVTDKKDAAQVSFEIGVRLPETSDSAEANEAKLS